MKKWTLGIFALLSIALLFYINTAIPVGSGYLAKNLCSYVFITKCDPEIALKKYINPMVYPLEYFIDVEVGENEVNVDVLLPFFKSKKAVYRDHLGCTVINKISKEELKKQKIVPVKQAKLSDDIAWPKGNADIDYKKIPENVNIDKINNTIDDMMREPDHGAPRQTNAIAVVYNGQLIAERYANGYNKTSRFHSWSICKSFINTLIGILVYRNELNINDKAPVEEWSKPDDPRNEITIDQLLRMSSGLNFAENYFLFKFINIGHSSFGEDAEMFFSHDNMAKFAYMKSLDAKPDTIWEYSSGTTSILSKIIYDTVGGTLNDYYTFVRKELFQKISATTAILEPDASGCMVGAINLQMTARDFARLGLLWLQDGVWEGKRILARGWIKYSTTATPTHPERRYGAHFWINRSVPGKSGSKRWPKLPDETFIASGYQGQNIVIVPSKKLIVARLAVTIGKDMEMRCDKDLQYLVGGILTSLP